MKGRGAATNPDNRFHAVRVETDRYCEPTSPPTSVATTLRPERVRRIISTNQSPDISFEQSINPYRGCEHGCIYCFARPTHAFLDLSPGLDFETQIVYKPEAAGALQRELSRPGYRCRAIALGTNTDPYQPAERRLRITREILETAAAFHQPIAIVTKSSLVTRDLDLLAPMADKNLCRVTVSVTTLDDDLKRRLEPRTPSGRQRLATVRKLREAGIPVGVLVAPMIPKINDHELEDIVAQCAQAGADSAGYVLIRLPLELRELFETWLLEHYPDRAEAVMSLIRQSRGGKAYQPQFGVRMRGTGPFADMISKRFKAAVRRNNLGDRSAPELDCTRFKAPGSRQFNLF